MSRKEAVELGLKTYFDGKKCSRGHLSYKRVANYTCEACQKEKSKQRYAQDSSKARLFRKEYYKRNADLSRKKTREYNLANKSAIRTKRKNSYAQNPEPHKERSKNYRLRDVEAYRIRKMQRYAALTEEERLALRERRRLLIANDSAFKELLYSKYKKYREQNIEVVRKGRTNYRARQMAATGAITGDDIVLRYSQQNGLCFYCDEILEQDFQVDHIMPLSRGGSNLVENLCCSCPKCNRRKNRKLPWIFLRMISRDRGLKI